MPTDIETGGEVRRLAQKYEHIRTWVMTIALTRTRKGDFYGGISDLILLVVLIIWYILTKGHTYIRLCALLASPYAVMRKRWTGAAPGPPAVYVEPGAAAEEGRGGMARSGEEGGAGEETAAGGRRDWMIGYVYDSLATLNLVILGAVAFDLPFWPFIVSSFKTKLGM